MIITLTRLTEYKTDNFATSIYTDKNYCNVLNNLIQLCLINLRILKIRYEFKINEVYESSAEL